MNFFKSSTLVSGVILLSACGGSSSNEPFTIDVARDVPIETIEDFFDASEEDLGEDFVARAQDLVGGVNGLAETPYTDPSTLPTSGGATYNGLLSIGPAIGEMELTANFRNSSIGGSVDNIILAEDILTTGSLTISSDNGSIDRTADTNADFTFSAALTGTISDDESDYIVDADIDGDFTGSDHEYVEGFVFGTVEATAFDTQETFDGEFVGQR